MYQRFSMFNQYLASVFAFAEYLIYVANISNIRQINACYM